MANKADRSTKKTKEARAFYESTQQYGGGAREKGL